MSKTQTPARQRGLSIIEFMVGIAVGLFVVAGATKLFVDYLVSNRKAMLETRVNQDLRAAADLIVRDLRRASYWRNATAGIYIGSTAPTLSNPYGAITYNKDGLGELKYSYSKDNVDVLDKPTEEFGVRADGALKLLIGGEWQPITDPTVMTVAAADLSIPVISERIVDLYELCPCLGKLTCTKDSFKDPDPSTSPLVTGANYANRPRVVVREYELRITGRSTLASANSQQVVRQIRERVRPRNDQAIGACPA